MESKKITTELPASKEVEEYVSTADDEKTAEKNVNSNDIPTSLPAGVRSIAQTLLDHAPEPSEHAIEQAETDQSSLTGDDLVDSQGRRFDPSIHYSNADGSPKLSPTGRLRIRRKRKSEESIIATPKEQKEIINPYQVGGVATANAIIMLGIVIGGEEWKPVKNIEIGLDEKNTLEKAFTDYFEAKGWEDIPPGIALTIAISAYILPRFTLPKTQERSKRFTNWIKKKYVYWDQKRKIKKNLAMNEKMKDIEPEDL
jgi:hypothetical protein